MRNEQSGSLSRGTARVPRRATTRPDPGQLLPGIRTALTSNAWFAALPEDVRDEVTARLRLRTARSGETIFARGARPDGIFAVIEGIVRVSGVARDGRETVLDFYGVGEWFGETATLSGEPRYFSAAADGDALVAHLRLADTEELLASRPAFSRAMLALEARRIVILLHALEQYSVLPMEQRLAARLLMLAGRFGKQTPRGLEITIELTHDTLARLIGSSRPRITRMLNRWRQAALIEHHYGHIVLRDLPQLRRLPEF